MITDGLGHHHLKLPANPKQTILLMLIYNEVPLQSIVSTWGNVTLVVIIQKVMEFSDLIKKAIDHQKLKRFCLVILVILPCTLCVAYPGPIVLAMQHRN